MLCSPLYHFYWCYHKLQSSLLPVNILHSHAALFNVTVSIRAQGVTQHCWMSASLPVTGKKKKTVSHGTAREQSDPDTVTACDE